MSDDFLKNIKLPDDILTQVAKSREMRQADEAGREPVLDESGRKVNVIRKGDEIDITAMDPTLKRLLIAVGWDIDSPEGVEPDLDVSVFLLNRDEMTRDNDDFVFYNNLKGAQGAVEHYGDSRTGAGDGDDETIFLDMNGISFDIRRIEFVISIYEAELRRHNFQCVNNVFLRVMNSDTGQELFRYELDQEFAQTQGATAIKVGHLLRNGPSWLFVAVGEGVQGGLGRLATDYGIIVAEIQTA